MAEEDVDWGMDEDFDPWQGAEEQINGSVAIAPTNVESSHGDARALQEQGFHSGSVGKVEGTTESQQRSATSTIHLAIGWTLRTSRHDPAKQYFYNPYTHATSWDQPEEPLIDESGITTPPLPQPRQETPTAGLQIRSSGRLTDHMKMAPIQQQPMDVASASSTPANSGRRDLRSGKGSDTTDNQGRAATPSKLRLIDRIQPVRYTPPEKTISLRQSSGPASRPSPANATHRTDRSASGSNAVTVESSKARDSSRADRAKPSPLPLTSESSQPFTGPDGTSNNDDAFALEKHAEKLPEWLVANDPKLDSDESSRRRPRGPEDATMEAGSSKRARYGPESVVVKGSGSVSNSKDRNPRMDNNKPDAIEPHTGLSSRFSDKLNTRDEPTLDHGHTGRDQSKPASGNNAGFGASSRVTEPDQGYSGRQAASGSRPSDIREPSRTHADDRQFAPTSSVEDRGRVMPTSSNSLGSRGNRSPPTSQRAPPPPPPTIGPRGLRPSGPNTAPLIANRWTGASPNVNKPSEAQTTPLVEKKTVEPVKVAPRSPPTLAESSKPKEYAYGPKAKKNNGSTPINDGARRASGPGPAPDRSPIEPNSRRLDANQPSTTRAPVKAPAWGPNAQPGQRSVNETSAPIRSGSSYRPEPPARAAWLNDARPALGSMGADPGTLAPRVPMDARGSGTDVRRGDVPFTSGPTSRPPLPPGRPRSPVPHLPAQARTFAPDRSGPPPRRSPSPPRFGPGPPRFGRDDRVPRTPDAFGPKPGPRDDARPHPRAPDLYTPGGHSPPRPSPRPTNAFAFGDSPRDQRFGSRRGPPNGRGHR